MPRSAQIIRRLLAALEGCAAEEAGLTAQEDWAGLAELFVRELALLHRLAHEHDLAGRFLADDTELQARVGAVQNRHAMLQSRLATGLACVRGRLDEIDRTRGRMRAVRGAYQLCAA